MGRRMTPRVRRNPFDELFVLEIATCHRGSLARGLRLVEEFGRVARFANVRAAIKLQVRDVDSFVHPDFRARQDVRYIRATLDRRLPAEDHAALVAAIRRHNCIPAATAFDEHSVETCERIGVEVYKLASSDVADWPLIERVAATHKPVIASTGGSSVKDTDDLVQYFARRGIPLAINHCVALYPTEDAELDLNQIDFLRRRYPGTTIGLSTHEHRDWSLSLAIAWAKGARTFERHVDLDEPGIVPYCSTPAQIASWLRTFERIKAMCGAPGTARRNVPRRETERLDSLLRGVYAARNLPAGHALTEADVALMIPLQRGQLSCRELIAGERLTAPVAAGAPVRLSDIGTPLEWCEHLMERGLAPAAGSAA